MDLLLQALANGILSGSLLAIPAMGFNLIYAVLRYPNFTVASYATIGAMSGWLVNTHFGIGILGGLVVAFLVSAVVGVCAEWIALRRLYAAGALTVAIASIALNLVLENVVRFFFGNDMRGLNLPIEMDMRIGDVFIGVQQTKNLLIAVVIMIGVFCFLRYTTIGRSIRASADNPDLARLKGINPTHVAAIGVFVGAGLAGVGGLLLGLDTSIDPMTGFRVLLTIFAAAILGGLGSIGGAVVGALALGLAEEIALLAFPATYRTGVGFVAILLMLTFRPRGLLGERAQ